MEFKMNEFIAYCLEMYAKRHGISGVKAFGLFNECGIIEDLLKHYEMLHTQGEGYIIPTIDEWISRARGAVQ